MLASDLTDKILSLDDLDKIRLIELLMDSLDRPSPEVEALWVKESEARYNAYKSGNIKGIPFEDIQKRYAQ